MRNEGRSLDAQSVSRTRAGRAALEEIEAQDAREEQEEQDAREEQEANAARLELIARLRQEIANLQTLVQTTEEGLANNSASKDLRLQPAVDVFIRSEKFTEFRKQFKQDNLSDIDNIPNEILLENVLDGNNFFTMFQKVAKLDSEIGIGQAQQIVNGKAFIEIFKDISQAKTEFLKTLQRQEIERLEGETEKLLGVANGSKEPTKHLPDKIQREIRDAVATSQAQEMKNRIANCAEENIDDLLSLFTQQIRHSFSEDTKLVMQQNEGLRNLIRYAIPLHALPDAIKNYKSRSAALQKELDDNEPEAGLDGNESEADNDKLALNNPTRFIQQELETYREVLESRDAVKPENQKKALTEVLFEINAAKTESLTQEKLNRYLEALNSLLASDSQAQDKQIFDNFGQINPSDANELIAVFNFTQDPWNQELRNGLLANLTQISTEDKRNNTRLFESLKESNLEVCRRSDGEVAEIAFIKHGMYQGLASMNRQALSTSAPDENSDHLAIMRAEAKKKQYIQTLQQTFWKSSSASEDDHSQPLLGPLQEYQQVISLPPKEPRTIEPRTIEPRRKSGIDIERSKPASRSFDASFVSTNKTSSAAPAIDYKISYGDLLHEPTIGSKKDKLKAMAEMGVLGDMVGLATEFMSTQSAAKLWEHIKKSEGYQGEYRLQDAKSDAKPSAKFFSSAVRDSGNPLVLDIAYNITQELRTVKKQVKGTGEYFAISGLDQHLENAALAAYARLLSSRQERERDLMEHCQSIKDESAPAAGAGAAGAGAAGAGAAVNADTLKKDPCFLKAIGLVKKYIVVGDERVACQKRGTCEITIEGEDKHKQGGVWRFYQLQGAPTDDSDQAMLKLWSLKIAKGNANLAASIFLKLCEEWRDNKMKDIFNRGPFGLGASTNGVLEKIKALNPEELQADPYASSRKAWVDDIKNNNIANSANGALMSNYQVVRFFHDDLDQAINASIAMAKSTHFDPEVSAHCVAQTVMLFCLMNHKEKPNDTEFEKFQQEALNQAKKTFLTRYEECKKIEGLSACQIKHQKVGAKAMKLMQYGSDEYKNDILNSLELGIMGEVKIDSTTHKIDNWNYFNNDGAKAENYPNIGLSRLAFHATFFGMKFYRTLQQEEVKWFVEGGEARSISGVTRAALMLADNLNGANELRELWADKEQNSNSVRPKISTPRAFPAAPSLATTVEKIPPLDSKDAAYRTVLEVVKRGGDADTLLSCMAPMLGAISGSETIPEIWQAELREYDKQLLNYNAQIVPMVKEVGLQLPKSKTHKGSYIRHVETLDDVMISGQERKALGGEKAQQRGASFRVSFSDDKTERKAANTKAQYQQIYEALLNSQSAAKMTKEEVIEAIAIAREHGGFKGLTTASANIESQKLKKYAKFSATFQKLTKAQGIYTGRVSNLKSMVGLRLAKIPTGVIDNCISQGFTGESPTPAVRAPSASKTNSRNNSRRGSDTSSRRVSGASSRRDSGSGLVWV